MMSTNDFVASSAVVPRGVLPFTVTTRRGTFDEGAERTSRGPTANAMRYVGSGFVGANLNVSHFLSLDSVRPVSAAFAIAMFPLGVVMETSNGTLNPGSSKHGNARRASIGSNCVKTYESPATTVLYAPTS